MDELRHNSVLNSKADVDHINKRNSRDHMMKLSEMDPSNHSMHQKMKQKAKKHLDMLI